ncbi:MAG: hypothetical protein GY729_15270 [Desulfobacteraceae bacterium]|nr:hypothetical protein [Desulfobacteraceae bacterium]
MKKLMMLIVTAIFTLSFTACSMAGETHVGQSVKHSGKAFSHGGASIGHSIAGSAQIVSAALAVPFTIVGSVGAVSTEISNELMKAATEPAQGPLVISDEAFTVGPAPNEALNNNAKTQ